MLHWFVFFTFICIGFIITRNAVARNAMPLRVSSAPPALALPPNLESDAACRMLLGLATEREAVLLREQFASGDASAQRLNARRGELIRAYAAGALAPHLREAFKRSLLSAPGIAEEVEVERALNAVAQPDLNNLRTTLTYKLSRMDALWRRLTLPRTDTPLSAAGPCLMIRPAVSDTAPVELEGLVTAASGDTVEINLGLSHGIGPGDFVQIQRSGEWLATGVIRSAERTRSRAVFMGEAQPEAGDSATAVLEGDVI